ncbi:secondary thiamine-phosphate synthase enzyme YjbQ [Proteus faecis]|uniref:Secondary thiamine-phosphate synthase enzyme YjbQ n=1 Tax=Proteus faecis TaxID=2050967 RepID=A0AAW7CI16_9GAMM|nr:secondary thiamine-phosphate synthase enzyme YjbQ [Proteus faecis]MBG3013286.1 YjbQ family protein [Proteus mirabilis]QNH66765.1 YjbQ family protein [Proteus vulgaris]MDL5165672.1 secondary thiamine-phosphate synthase enzyme YjbQ [Proteus faecis]MDL5274064.1 secondary thiamine-phosphate synthase enzyme YjbQ [Proteus faecis]MDL5277634.1 secondary thiamine-phosphate synthase enzyme YjbQ [Proteus faecis]
MWFQKNIVLNARPRGFHLITQTLIQELPQLRQYKIGIAHFFIQHTSASLTINENADPTVRSDFESFFNRSVKEDEDDYLHTYEGSDDMPAHIKSSLLGQSVTIPISQGELNLGIWQGIYLGEHRNHGGERRIIVTLQGECY